MTDINKRMGQIYKEKTELENKLQLIRATHTVEIFADPLNNIDYNSRSRLRDAKLTICLSEDQQYQKMLQQLLTLRVEEASFEPETL